MTTASGRSKSSWRRWPTPCWKAKPRCRRKPRAAAAVAAPRTPRRSRLSYHNLRALNENQLAHGQQSVGLGIYSEGRIMAITAADVMALRNRTNLPMMDCKAALGEAGGDMEKAIEILRKKFKDAHVKRGDRETAEGRVTVYIDPAKQLGAILELRCESAPV